MPNQTEAPAFRRRILLVSATYPPTRCGVGDYTRRLAEALVARGVEVHVLTSRSTDPLHQHVGPDELGHVGPPPPRESVELPPPVRTVDGALVHRVVDRWDWGCVPPVEAALERLGVGLVNLQYHGEDYLLHPAVCTVAEQGEARGIPTVTTFHNLQKPRGWTHGEPPLPLLLGSSRRWVTTNELDRAEMAALGGADGKLRLVSTGSNLVPADGLDFHDAPPREGSPFHAAYYGFLNPFKGLEYLLRAVSRLLGEGRELRLTMAAGIHTDATSRLRDYSRFIEDEIVRLGLGPHLDRPGFLEGTELSRLLHGCDLAVFPFREGLCGKNSSFWGSLDHGTASLTTTGPGLPKGLRDRENVFLSLPEDEVALAKAMAWAMDHPERLPGIGRAGRDYVRDHLGWDALATSLLSIFEEAIQECE